MNIEVSSLMPNFDDEHFAILQGELPYTTIIENLVAQFNELGNTGSLISDHTNYITAFQDAVTITKQVHRAAFEEYEIDDMCLRQMQESVTDILLYCMEEIGCDLYQLEDPFQTACVLYNNFILVDQRQPFFEYAVRRIVGRTDTSSPIVEGYNKFLQKEPQPLYDALQDVDLSQYDSIAQYLQESGNPEISQLVLDGYIPENVMLDIYLKPISFNKAFSTFYMNSAFHVQSE